MFLTYLFLYRRIFYIFPSQCSVQCRLLTSEVGQKVRTINLKMFARSVLRSTHVGFIKPSQDIRKSIKMRFTKKSYFAML